MRVQPIYCEERIVAKMLSIHIVKDLVLGPDGTYIITT